MITFQNFEVNILFLLFNNVLILNVFMVLICHDKLCFLFYLWATEMDLLIKIKVNSLSVLKISSGFHICAFEKRNVRLSNPEFSKG